MKLTTQYTMPNTPWTQLDKLISDYVDAYELCDSEDDEGNTGDYQPTEQERMLIMDAIQGLLGDNDIMAKIAEAREYSRAQRLAVGDCVDCGAPLPEHWGGCSSQQNEVQHD